MILLPAKNGTEKGGKMSPLKSIKTVIMTAGFIPAVFLSVSCQAIEDWFDRNKPEPEEGLTGNPRQNESHTYTVDEAVAFVCNRLIMKFSMHYSGKPYLVINDSDAMAKKVAQQLYRSNVADSWNANSSEKCLIRTLADSSDSVWHIIAVDPKTMQKLLFLSLPLKKE